MKTWTFFFSNKPGYLKDVSDVLAKPPWHQINLCLQTGTVPTEFEIIRNTPPVFKLSWKQLTDNYRLITVLPVSTKILEKLVHNQLVSFMEEYGLLSKYQLGFHKQWNTKKAEKVFADSIRKNGMCYFQQLVNSIWHSAIHRLLQTSQDVEQVWKENYLQITCSIEKTN